ncbi:hypothetical protein [Micromonospora sp. DT31]|uniref:hypothetical protein n=1 Tax=Micromonospora sp. DT31 TaxID=3393434 RepID=UPI003CF032C9
MKRRTTTGRPKNRSRLRTAVAVAVISGVGGAAGFAPLAAAAPPTPTFGPGIDGYQPYVGQGSCNPTPKPGVVEFHDMVLAAYPGTGDSGISRDCGTGGQSEHKEGRAWDWGVSAATQRPVADDLLNWLLATDRHGNAHALARRLGIMYIIWDARIWKAYEAGAGWQPYSCSDVTSCHQDHVHFSFGWPGANKQTSWWTGQQPPAPVYGRSTVGWYRSSDASFHLTNAHSGGASAYAYVLGSSGMIPLTGDWDGNGTTTSGWYRPSDGSFHLRNSHGNGPSDYAFVYGPPNMVPITGDWNGDGKTTVGWYRGSDASYHLTNGSNGGETHYAFVFGPPNMTPITGDWNADGKTTVGWYRGSDASYHLTNGSNGGETHHAFVFGPPNMTPVTGDWNNA